MRHLLAHALHSKSNYQPDASRILVLRRDPSRHHVRVPARQPLLLLEACPKILQDFVFVNLPQVYRQVFQRDGLMADGGKHQQLKGILSEADSEGVPEEGGGRGGDDRHHCHQVHGYSVHCVSVKLCTKNA